MKSTGKLEQSDSTNPCDRLRPMEQELHKALVDYATQHAGTDADIDLELENAAADYLSSSE